MGYTFVCVGRPEETFNAAAWGIGIVRPFLAGLAIAFLGDSKRLIEISGSTEAMLTIPEHDDGVTAFVSPAECSAILGRLEPALATAHRYRFAPEADGILDLVVAPFERKWPVLPPGMA